ncbi:MAG: DUF2804 domain-containing protein [Bacillota bacterium]|nr:DUF2804 domain-containing protein [Bacillota bacterium]
MQKRGIYDEPELALPVNLCLPDGKLNQAAVGWSRQPLHNCNLAGACLRKKRWNYWCVTTDKFLFSATLSNIDYLGLAFVYFLDFETNYFHELTVIRPFGSGCVLGNRVKDDIKFIDKRLEMSFINSGSHTLIKLKCPHFGGHRLKVDLRVKIPLDHETLNVVIPWNTRRFQFTSKQNTMPVEGMIRLGEKEYHSDDGYACLDFGRGIWPYSSFWNWASASGTSRGHLVGLNFGAGWTDGTGMNENGICIDGVLTKISEDLVFEYNPGALMNPWRIRTAVTDKVDVTLVPFYERVARTDLVLLKSEVHQMIGHFSGRVTDSGGAVYSFADMIGWAEEHHAKW